MSSVTMTIRVSQDTKDALGRIAAATRRTNSYLAAEAIEAYVAQQMAIVEGIQAGLDDLKTGRTVPHDTAMARLEATIAAAEREGMSRRVEWSASALDDLDQSVAYIARYSPAAAREVAATIGRNALALALRPTGRPGRVPGTYEKSVGGLPYVIAYAVPDEARLVVLRVIHTARDWPSGAWPKA